MTLCRLWGLRSVRNGSARSFSFRAFCSSVSPGGPEDKQRENALSAKLLSQDQVFYLGVVFSVFRSASDSRARLEMISVTVNTFRKSLPDVPNYRKATGLVDMELMKKSLECIGKQGEELHSVRVKDLLELAVFYTEDKSVGRIGDTAPRLSESDSKAMESSFVATTFQNAPASRKLKAELEQKAKLWTEGSPFYAPYAALVNASMTGKSRLLAELRNEGVFVVTYCLRPTSSAGYWPPRTPLVADWATSSVPADLDVLQYTAQTCELLHSSLIELHKWLLEQDPSQVASLPCWTSDGRAKDEQQRKLEFLTKAWYDFVMDRDTHPWEQVMERVNATNIKDVPIAFSASATSLALKASEIAAHWRETHLDRIKDKIHFVLKSKFGISLGWDALHVCFVVDETRQLTVMSADRNRFAVFRRALKALPFNSEGPNMFCVVTDTTSRIANLSPASALDGSWRVRDPKDKLDLFSPCRVFDSIDAWWHTCNRVGARHAHNGQPLQQRLLLLREELNNPRSGASGTAEAERESVLKNRVPVDLLQSFEFMSMFGRPAFYAFLHKRGPPLAPYACISMLDIVKAKLLRQDPTRKPGVVESIMYPDDEILEEANSGRGVNECSQFTQTQALAVLGSMASIDISMASRMASELSSGHMRLLAAISEKRQFVYTLEVSEPVLALAAHSLVLSGKIPWYVLINKFCSAVINNSTQPGHRGEFATQFVLLMAWQKCLLNMYGPKPELLNFPLVSAAEFLETLLAKPLSEARKKLDYSGKRRNAPSVNTVASAVELVANFEKLKKSLDGGYLRLNQFVKTVSPPSRKMLMDYFLRASGIFCRENQAATDLIIPIQYLHENQHAETRNVGAFLFQLKLRKDTLGHRNKSDIREGLSRLAVKLTEPEGKKVNGARPNGFVGICLCLNSEGKDNLQARIDSISSEEGDLVPMIFATNIKPTDVLGEEPLLADAFHRLINTSADPITSLHILTDSQDAVKEAFRTQPYSCNPDYD